MMIALHKNARTTPAIRSEIAASTDSVVALAQRYGISEETARKWKKRTSVHDASHTPHRLQTTLTPAQEHVVVELRRTLLLPLDDLLAVTREFICAEARSHPLWPGSLFAPPWRWQPERAQTRAACAREQDVQGLRAGVPAPGPEVPAADAGREQSALPVRGHRPRHALGVRADQEEQDGGQCQGVSQCRAQGLPDAHSEGAHRQRQGVH